MVKISVIEKKEKSHSSLQKKVNATKCKQIFNKKTNLSRFPLLSYSLYITVIFFFFREKTVNRILNAFFDICDSYLPLAPQQRKKIYICFFSVHTNFSLKQLKYYYSTIFNFKISYFLRKVLDSEIMRYTTKFVTTGLTVKRFGFQKTLHVSPTIYWLSSPFSIYFSVVSVVQ